jgi:hypothetical protein
MKDFFHNPIVYSILVGWGTAALVDFNAFRAWKNWNDAVSYDYKTMILRWGQGIAIGFTSGLGLKLTA